MTHLRAIADHMPSLSACERLAHARHLIVDLDGTLIREDELLPGAAALLVRFAGRYQVVSNNSTHTAEGVSLRLRRLGLEVAAQNILLAGEQSVQYLRRHHPRARVLLVGTPVLARYAQEQGCRLVESDAEVVLLALDPGFDVGRLQRMVNELRRGALLLVSNIDANHPGPGGRVIPETGALLAAVTTASGIQPYRVIGKPEPAMLQEALRRMGASVETTVVIGDNPATDALGARRAGLGCITVGRSASADIATLEALWAPVPISVPQ